MKHSIVTGLALSSSLVMSSGLAVASDNPFSATQLDSGYQQTEAGKKAQEGKCGEGKCGGENRKAKEGKCGGDKKKSKEGKCGEGKCGS